RDIERKVGAAHLATTADVIHREAERTERGGLEPDERQEARPFERGRRSEEVWITRNARTESERDTPINAFVDLEGLRHRHVAQVLAVPRLKKRELHRPHGHAR